MYNHKRGELQNDAGNGLRDPLRIVIKTCVPTISYEAPYINN